ncbi:MAG: pyridoxamine 5'-phosphate oxidase family protein [Anaerolineales bacterium]|nr:pyridoxamine 5'-phosphate oxidase family protein [Anaerolineales bacterium]
MNDEDLGALARLLRTQRIAALGTLHAGAPSVAHVVFAAAPDFSAIYLHLSRLAAHTRDLLADPRCSLLFVETERPGQNPLTLARVSLHGVASVLAPDAAEYATAKTLYIEKLPFTEFNFTLGDFGLFRFTPAGGRFVGGFARAHDVTPTDLARAAAL